MASIQDEADLEFQQPRLVCFGLFHLLPETQKRTTYQKDLTSIILWHKAIGVDREEERRKVKAKNTETFPVDKA
jgi:hypothetical protein